MVRGSVQQTAGCNHNYQVTKTDPPTCGTNGRTIKTCTICGDVIEETLPATGNHDFSGNKLTCPVCGAKNPNYRAPEEPKNETVQDTQSTNTTVGNNT